MSTAYEIHYDYIHGRVKSTVEFCPVIERDALAAAFNNFHRQLCERFGYSHDEVDWQRDQISLIEHIAAELTTWQRMRNEAMAVATANRERITALEAELANAKRIMGFVLNVFGQDGLGDGAEGDTIAAVRAFLKPPTRCTCKFIGRIHANDCLLYEVENG